jgi:hypothetical protein
MAELADALDLGSGMHAKLSKLCKRCNASALKRLSINANY